MYSEVKHTGLEVEHSGLEVEHSGLEVEYCFTSQITIFQHVVVFGIVLSDLRPKYVF